MPEIRINNIPTTATSTASDDFFAIDGSNNNTRKISAYSPTFGGNLTVSGTGTSTFAGNLTVSGGSVSLNALTGNAPQFRHHAVGTADIIGGVNGIRFLNNAASTAGMSLDASNNMTLAGTLTVSGGTITSGSGTLTLNSSANTVVLQSAGSTALTLDTSQNATFAGKIGIGVSPSSWNLNLQQSVVNSAVRIISPTALGLNDSSIYIAWASGSKAVISASYESTGSYRPLVLSTGGVDSLTLDTSGNATFAGNLTVSGVITGTQSANNGTQRFNSVNTSAGTAAVSGYLITGDTNLTVIQQYSTGYSTSGINIQNTALLYTNAAGLNLCADNASGAIGFYTGGQNLRMTISSAGNATLSGNLTVSGTGTSSVAGNLGIGTTSPLGVLDVRSTTPDVLFNGKDTADPVLYFGRYQYDNVSKSGAAIKYVHGSAGGSQEYGRLTFLTATGSFGALTERMRINESGNLLIGTNIDAGGKLQIATGASNTLLIGNDATYTSYNQISLNGTRTNSGVLGIIGGGTGDSQLYLLAPTGGGLLFQIAGSTVFSVNSSGNATFAASLTTVGRVLNTSVKTANYTVATSNHVIICNSASAFTITMIAASSNTGRQFIIKNKGAGEITVDATSLGQIDGLNTITLSQYQSTMLVSDGTTWNRI